MYFNNVHILYYVAIAMIGLLIGKFTAWCNVRIPEKKKIFSREFFKLNKEGLPKNYIFMTANACFYVTLLYKFGINQELIKNFDLIKFLILIPMLLLVISIDVEKRIIPNRLTLTIFEIGLLLTFVYGINNINMAKEYILGMAIGASIFIIITLLGWIIAGKEAMGMGDVKLMGALGLYFGINSIAEISMLSFFVAAIFSILILFIRLIILRRKDEYIPFGPFIVIATIICILLPSNYVFDTFMNFCRMLGDKIF